MNHSLLFILLAAFFGASTAVAAKISLQVFEPFTITAIRFGFATITLLPFVLAAREWGLHNLKNLSIVSYFGAANPIIFIIAIQITTVSATALIYAAVPLMTACYLFVTKGTRVAKNTLTGVIIGFGGVAMIVLLPLLGDNAASDQSLLGNLLIFVAAIALMIYGLLSKKEQEQKQISSLSLVFYFCLFAFIFSLPLAIIENIQQPLTFVGVTPLQIFALFWVGVISTSAAYLAYQYALRISGATKAALFTYLQPPMAIVLAMLFLDEKVSLALIVGGSLAFFGVYLTTKKSHASS